MSPRIAYIDREFKAATLNMIEQATFICEAYAAQGYELTLRQLYYQFVARDLIENTQRSYKRLGEVINNARLAGLIDWDHITDRTRHLRSPNTWDSPNSIINASASQFTRDLWDASEQKYRVQVWVEKDALVDVVAQACDRYQVPYFACRGYVSQSEMWTAGRLLASHEARGHPTVVLHLGDHDPSGIDMSRDIDDRLSLFAERPIDVRRIALNMNQIQQYDPPPNPAKTTDSRSGDYIREFGTESWELDALEPQVLDRLITKHIKDCITSEENWLDAESADRHTRRRMQEVASRWDDLNDNWTQIEELLGDLT